MNCYQVEIKKHGGKTHVHIQIEDQGFFIQPTGDRLEDTQWLKRMVSNALYNLYQKAYQDGVNDNKQGRAK